LASDRQGVLTRSEDDETPQPGGGRLGRRLAAAPKHVCEAAGEQREEYRKDAARGRQGIEPHLL